MGKISFRITMLFLLQLQVAFAQLNFAPFQLFPTPRETNVVKIGDVNHDGKNDVVLATWFETNTQYQQLYVYLQNNAGGLNAPISYSYGLEFGQALGIDIADMNNDGRNDVILDYGQRIKIFYQNAGGSLIASDPILFGDSVNFIKAADLNNDGLLDIAVSSDLINVIKVLYQLPNGVFNPVTYPKPDHNYGIVAVGDVNNDGLNDVVFNSINTGIDVYLQNVSGFLNPYVEYTYTTVGPNLIGIVIADFNNDGLNDVAGGRDYEENSTLRFWNQDPQTHQLVPSTEIPMYLNPDNINAADLNGDGKIDLAVVNGTYTAVSTYTQTLQNTFGGYQLFPLTNITYTGPQGASLGDINNDGTVDMVISDEQRGLVVFYNNTVLETDQFTATPEVVVYPIPATEELNIESAAGELSETALWNAQGQSQKIRLTQKNGSAVIDLSDMPAGFYFLKTTINGATIIKKVLKK